MYREQTKGWLKHFDFAVLDLLCLQLSFWLAYMLTGHGWNPYELNLYRSMALFLTMSDIVVIFSFNTLKNVMKRGHYREFIITLKHVAIVECTALFWLFLMQRGNEYSRSALLMLGIVYAAVDYTARELWKQMLKKRMKRGYNKVSLLIITTRDIAEEVVERVETNNFSGYNIQGVAILDDKMEQMTGQHIGDLEVVAAAESVPMYVCSHWIDEVLVIPSNSFPYPQKLIEQIEEAGVTVHINLSRISMDDGKKQVVGRVGGYTVLTSSVNYASGRQLLAKRLLDIAGGIVGCVITGILCIFVAPAIYISSPGPIFFAQERVGKNGKKFKIYKFRSMCMDAEEKLKELMTENKMEDNRMFKMDFDPRVIGNRILPDGTRKTGIGDFIRRTSIDEFPQFFNVLLGQMSLVGTRPPTVRETQEYELHHWVRLATKPGITGLWQISGRSNITDFEEVVRMDREYISNWSIGLDIKILLKTVLVVLKRDGAE